MRKNVIAKTFVISFHAQAASRQQTAQQRQAARHVMIAYDALCHNGASGLKVASRLIKRHWGGLFIRSPHRYL